MSANDDYIKQINSKLDAIKETVDREAPSVLSIWINRLKYAAIGVAWIVGAISHKWGLFEFLSKLTK